MTVKLSENSINSRIELLIKELGLNKNSFSKLVGMTSNAVLENIVGKRQSKPSYEILNSIILSIDGINANWLITGRGEMFLKKSDNNVKKDLNKVDQSVKLLYEERIKELKEQITELKEDKAEYRSRLKEMENELKRLLQEKVKDRRSARDDDSFKSRAG